MTETDKQQSLTDKFIQAESNSVIQVTQKGNISLVNLNNDSNFYGSESTNEPNSVKKCNLTSSQLSYNFGKYSKGVQDQKTQISSQESNNNSQETVKLQSNSKNFMEFAQFPIKHFPNEEEDEEKPEVIQYQKHLFPTIEYTTNEHFNNQAQQRSSTDYLNVQQGQQNSPTQSRLSCETAQYKSSQKQQNEQFIFNSSDQFQSNRNGIQEESRNEREFPYQGRNNKPLESGMINKGKVHKKKNSNIRFSSYNNRNSPSYLEQSTYIIDETLKQSTHQNIFHKKHNRYAINDDEHDEIDKKSGQIPHISIHQQEDIIMYHKSGAISDKENNRNYENHSETAYYQQAHMMKNMNANDIKQQSQQSSSQLQQQLQQLQQQSQQNTFTSPHSPSNNVLFTDQISLQINKQNENQSQQQQDQLMISGGLQQRTNKIGQISQGDKSPSTENTNNYISFWNKYKSEEEESRRFTCKEFCSLLWPQKLDRQKRHDKELIIKLYEAEYNKEDAQHKNLLDAVSLYYYRFMHGNNYNSIEDKELSKRQYRHPLPKKSYKSHEDNYYNNNNKRVQSLSELCNDPKSSLNLKVFSLLHILAFLNNQKDIFDQIHHKLFKKIYLIYLLIKISNVVLLKFKENLFDKSIQLMKKDVIDFLNDIFYSIFYESIQTIIVLDTFEINQINIKLYNTVEQIDKQLTNTTQIIKFIQKNTPQHPKIIQTLSNTN